MSITRGFTVWPKVKSPAGGGWQWFAAAWTAPFRHSFYGHVEKWFLEDGVWVRATATTDKGVVWTNIGGAGQVLQYNPAWYHYHPLPDDYPFDEAKAFVLSELGAGYDWDGINHWWCGWFKPSGDDWFCSELDAKLNSLYEPWAKLFTDPFQWSPNGVHRDLHILGNHE